MAASFTGTACYAASPTILSHTPLRPLPQPSARPLGTGPARFVDAARGTDGSDGSQRRPWRSINYAMRQLVAGETLYLRGGNYYENVYCAVTGTAQKPITIRSYPGELATINGGLSEFEKTPASAWEPAPDGVPGEYRSTKVYRNIRDVVGIFGDSNLGLQTYWYRADMQAKNESWIPNPDTFIEPMYCGPGLWYDKMSARIHVRLAHTALEFPASVRHKVDNYKGETDPRRLPLVIVPFNACPLFVDQAQHVSFQDLAIRGGGHTCVRLNFGISLDFDRCSIIAGNYGIWAKGVGPLKMTNCGIRGNIAPWMFRTENALYSYSPKVYPPFLDGLAPEERPGSTTVTPARVVRHISRMPTHAVLATEGGFEFDTFYYPLNHDWEISNCEFTDGHDGIYLSGRDIKFHHNLVDNMQDDAIYISSPTPYITDGLYVYENLIRQCVAGFGAHGRGGPGGNIYLYRNVVDMRENLQFNRPFKDKPEGEIFPGSAAWLVHNADHIIHMENVFAYQNTTITEMRHAVNSYSGSFVFGTHPDAARRVFNNLFVYAGGAKQYPVAYGAKPEKADLVFDGNLHWNTDPAVLPPANYFESSRTHPLSEANKKNYPDGWDAHSLAVDPKFLSYGPDKNSDVDLRLQPGSPAKGAGVALPSAWPDPFRPRDNGRPDIGAIPVGGAPLRVGIEGRVTAGESRLKGSN